jgi:hypothetical protein
MNSKTNIEQDQPQLTLSTRNISLLSKFILFFVLYLFSGCLTEKYDYGYTIWIKNETNDTLHMQIGFTSINTINTNNQFTIFPNDTIDGVESMLGGIKIKEGMDPAEYFLNEKPLFDSVLVYKKDVLKAAWYYPARRMPVSEHSFFNYNSWDTWLYDKNYGVMMFSIYESDLKLNK